MTRLSCDVFSVFMGKLSQSQGIIPVNISEDERKELPRTYMAPSDLSILSLAFFIFFWLTFSFSTSTTSMWHGELMYGLMRPWARYVRRLMCGARFTWMWSMTRWSASRPLYSAFDSAFLRRWSRNSADFLGQRPCEVPCTLA